MQTLSLTCFGVGDGWPCPDRNHASFLYRIGRATLLVDCGEAVDGSFKASGADYNAIDGILLSHLHSDHFGGFFMLMQGAWLERRRRSLPVLVPKGAIKPLKQMLEAAFLFDDLRGFDLRFAALKAGRSITIRGARITPFATSHLAGLRARFQDRYPRTDFSSFSFLIESSGLTVGHSADLGRPEDLEPLLRKPLDLLVCELAHFAPEEIFLYLRGRLIQQIVFVHLARAYWEDLGRIRRLAAKMLPSVRLAFPADREVVEV